MWEGGVRSTLCAVLEPEVSSEGSQLRLRFLSLFPGGSCMHAVGIAPNRMLAKIASDRNKPNGQFALVPFTRQAVMQFMADLDLR